MASSQRRRRVSSGGRSASDWASKWRSVAAVSKVKVWRVQPLDFRSGARMDWLVWKPMGGVSLWKSMRVAPRE